MIIFQDLFKAFFALCSDIKSYVSFASNGIGLIIILVKTNLKHVWEMICLKHLKSFWF